MNSYSWIDVTEPFGQHFHLGTAYGTMRSGQLAIDIRGLHGIGIHKSQLPYPRTAKHLGSIGSYTSYTNNQYVGFAETVHFVTTQQ